MFVFSKAVKRGFIEHKEIESGQVLIKKIGISESMLSRYMNDKSLPNLEMIKKFAAAFEVKLSEFIKWGE